MKALWFRFTVVLVGVLAGFALFTWVGFYQYLYPAEFILALAAILIAWVKPAANRVHRLAESLENMTARRHAVFVACFGVVILVHLIVAAHRGHRLSVPQLHDEQMYLLQARQMASGHLAMPEHAYPQFFDTFYVLNHPVYASMYFPGTALYYVPAIWMRLPWVAWPLMTTTALVLMTYLVGAKIISRAGALVASICLLAIDAMNWLPTMTMSHTLAGLQGMTVIYAWLRWRSAPLMRWVIVGSVSISWMLITRPLEGLAFGIPVFIAMLVTVRRANIAMMFKQFAVASVIAVPFLSLQLAFDYRVTGHLLKLPISLYVEQEFPGLSTMGGVKEDPRLLKTTSTLLQKRVFYQIFTLPLNLQHLGESFWQGLSWRVKLMLVSSSAHPLLCLLLPLGLTLLSSTPGRVLWSIVFCYIAGYMTYGVYLTQYSIQIAPVLLILTIGGYRWLCIAFAARAPQISSVYLVTSTALALETLAIMPNTGLPDPVWNLQEINYVTFPKVIKKPAIVFIRYTIQSNPHVEMVYNLEAASPDDATIIRAHDLGINEDRKLIDYYAQKQPWREVYFFDRASMGPLRDAGNVLDLSRRLRADATEGTPSTRP